MSFVRALILSGNIAAGELVAGCQGYSQFSFGAKKRRPEGRR